MVIQMGTGRPVDTAAKARSCLSVSWCPGLGLGPPHVAAARSDVSSVKSQNPLSSYGFLSPLKPCSGLHHLSPPVQDGPPLGRLCSTA